MIQTKIKEPNTKKEQNREMFKKIGLEPIF